MLKIHWGAEGAALCLDVEQVAPSPTCKAQQKQIYFQ